MARIRPSITARHGGVDRAHRWLLTPPDSTFTEAGTSPKDSQLTELREHEVRKVARFFRIPVAMIGDLSPATWSNFEQSARQELLRVTEIEHCESFQLTLQNALFRWETSGAAEAVDWVIQRGITSRWLRQWLKTTQAATHT